MNDPNEPKFNHRSYAPSPTQIAVLTDVTAAAIQNGIDRLKAAVDLDTLTDEQRTEAIRLLANGVTEGLKAEISKFGILKY